MPARPEPMRIELPGVGPVQVRALDPEVDAVTLHDWLSRDYARFWGMQGKTLEEVRDKYRGLLAEGREEMAIALDERSGRPLFVFMAYDPRHDLLQRFYTVKPGDRGFHVLMGPPGQDPVPALTFHAFRTIARWIFRDPAVSRLVGEPDIRNRKVLARLVQTGFEFGSVVHLPHKTALMIYMSRERHQALQDGMPPPNGPVPLSDRAVKLHMLAGRIGRKLGIYERNW